MQVNDAPRFSKALASVNRPVRYRISRSRGPLAIAMAAATRYCSCTRIACTLQLGLALATTVIGLPGVAMADWRDTFTDPYDGAFDVSRYLSEHAFGFLPVPIVITEPAVGVGFGMMGLFFPESEAQRRERKENAQGSGSATLPANVSIVGAAATDNGTWGVGVGHLGFWKEDRLRCRGFLAYASPNLDFYTLGGIELPRPIELNIEGPAIINELKFRLGSGNWFIGPRQTYRRVETTLERDEDAIHLPPPGSLPQLDRFIESNLDRTTVTSGLGVVAEFDSTDNPFNPERGLDYTFSYSWFGDSLGSDVDYTAYNATALNYWTLADKYVLGLRLQYDGISADDDTRLPAYVPPAVDLRGVSATRDQGNDVIVAEAALDYKLNGRWKVGVFVGAGRAAQGFDDLGTAPSIVSKGVGFRYLIARQYGFVMGLDFADGPEENAFYIQAGSTW